jgi:hypothetical protein
MLILKPLATLFKAIREDDAEVRTLSLQPAALCLRTFASLFPLNRQTYTKFVKNMSIKLPKTAAEAKGKELSKAIMQAW